MSSGHWQSVIHHLQLERSTGWALALAINALLLLMLTLPMRQDGAAPAPLAKVQELAWISLDPPLPAPPPVPPPAPPPRPHALLSETLRSPAPPLQRAVLEAAPAPTEAAASNSAVALEAAPPGAQIAATVVGHAEASIDYEHAPLPPYPRSELQRGVQGTVILRIAVDGEGRVLEVQIEQSSGHRRLDRAAQQQVARHWRFRPARRDGLPVAGWVRVPIEFSVRR
jgi:protein TonB